jgi:hypothetical protein
LKGGRDEHVTALKRREDADAELDGFRRLDLKRVAIYGRLQLAVAVTSPRWGIDDDRQRREHVFE